MAKTVLVTGSSRGLGTEIALQFARSGYNVVINYFQHAQLARQIIHEIGSDKAIAIKADVCDSITCDRGSEFTSSLFIYSIEDTYGKKLYYADPQSPGQRGTNERMNRELRRVFPAGYDFTKITQRKLQNAIQEINERPRNVLRFKTPEKVFTKRITAA